MGADEQNPSVWQQQGEELRPAPDASPAQAETIQPSKSPDAFDPALVAEERRSSENLPERPRPGYGTRDGRTDGRGQR
ncbi:MAG: hypothetical protein M3Q29_19140 [Chloroflexota bacterium]|nr:hypothetical protein [Chloroflexota bacterium]